MRGIQHADGKEQNATMADRKAAKSFVWGAVAGAVAALLLAPKSGRELRRDIAATARSVGGKTATLAGEAKRAAGRLVTGLRARRQDGADASGPEAEEQKIAP